MHFNLSDKVNKDRDSEISKSKISNRDRKEFDRLFTKYFVRLAKYAYKYVSSVDDARDLTQSVFLKIWELNGKWNPKGSIKAYLYIAVKNECLNHIKHHKLVDQWKRNKQAEKPIEQTRLKWDDEKRGELLGCTFDINPLSTYSLRCLKATNISSKLLLVCL